MTELQTVIAAPGEVPATLRNLLELADRPQDIHYPGSGVEIHVPEYLMDRWRSATRPRRKRQPKHTKEEG